MRVRAYGSSISAVTLSGSNFLKRAFQKVLTCHFVAPAAPYISRWPLKVSVQHSHSPSTLLSEKGCPTHPPTKPQGGQSTPLPLLGCGRDPSCTLPPGGAAWFQPTCRPLFPPLQRGCLFATKNYLLQRGCLSVTKNYLQSKKKLKKSSQYLLPWIRIPS